MSIQENELKITMSNVLGYITNNILLTSSDQELSKTVFEENYQSNEMYFNTESVSQGKLNLRKGFRRGGVKRSEFS